MKGASYFKWDYINKVGLMEIFLEKKGSSINRKKTPNQKNKKHVEKDSMKREMTGRSNFQNQQVWHCDGCGWCHSFFIGSTFLSSIDKIFWSAEGFWFRGKRSLNSGSWEGERRLKKKGKECVDIRRCTWILTWCRVHVPLCLRVRRGRWISTFQSSLKVKAFIPPNHFILSYLSSFWLNCFIL